MSKPAIDARPTEPATWKLEKVKTRSSELVRGASAAGPQASTVRGRHAVVVTDAGDDEKRVAPGPELSFVAFLESLRLDALDLTREPDIDGEVEL